MKNTQTCPTVESYTYCSMNKQYMEESQNDKKAYLMSVGNIVLWLYRSLVGSETTFLFFKEQKQIEVEEMFLG